MATYRVHELRFEVPAGYEDRSLNVLIRPGERSSLSVTIAREPRSDDPLATQATATARKLAEVTGLRVRTERKQSIASLPGHELSLDGHVNQSPIYQRQMHVDWFGTLLLLTVTSHRSRRAECDRIADELLHDGIRFRKRSAA